MMLGNIYTISSAIRSNRWPHRPIHNVTFCVVETDARDPLRQNLLNVPYERTKLPKYTNPLLYGIKNTHNIGIGQSSKFYSQKLGQSLGQSVIRLMATLKSLKSNDAWIPQYEREQLLGKNQFWFTRLDEITNEIHTKPFENRLMALLYVDSGYDINKVYAISRQENLGLHEFCLGEIERLFVKQSFFGSKLIQSCFSNFFPSSQLAGFSIITQLILKRERLQRLSWLGDAVLHTFVSQQILTNEIIIPENFQWYNSDAALAKVAKEMRFDDIILELSQQSAATKRLASLVEALIGCCFLFKQDINSSCWWLLKSEEWIKASILQ